MYSVHTAEANTMVSLIQDSARLLIAQWAGTSSLLERELLL